MPYAITPGCCSDASCIAVCPVNCIHPTPDEPDFGHTATLYVDPEICIDCGACADACPVDAIGPAELLTGSDEVFAIANAEYYRDRPAPAPIPLAFPTMPARTDQLQVAVVGAGPAAHYTTDLLLTVGGAEVTMFDRLPVPGGLLRYGVAPDHPSTKKLTDRFIGFLNNPRLHMMMGVEVGQDVTPEELREHFDAVVYAFGAATSRDLAIPGEDLPGSLSATEFVAWYNGHPDAVAPTGLNSDRAVVIGNGNVALDVARILLVDRDALATTDVADHAVAALRSSPVREVVISARRGPEHAAFTPGEMHALRHLPGAELVIADGPGVRDAIATAEPGTSAAALSDVPIVTAPMVDGEWGPVGVGRRIVLQFSSVPERLAGERRGLRGRVPSGRTGRGLAVPGADRSGHPGRGLPRAGAGRVAVRRPQRDGAQPCRTGHRRRRGPGAGGGVRRRLDQARGNGRDRREPSGCDRDGGESAPGRCRRDAAAGATDPAGAAPTLEAQPAGRGRTGRRAQHRPERAAQWCRRRPSADQVHHRARTAPGQPPLTSRRTSRLPRPSFVLRPVRTTGGARLRRPSGGDPGRAGLSAAAWYGRVDA